VRVAGLLVILLLACAPGWADELPGADAVFAARGVGIFWGVVRGPDEARTLVVVHIERLDRAAAPWRLVSVEAIDPFTRRREWVRLALDLDRDGGVTVEMPREGFLAKPARRILFYRHAAALQGDRPELVVLYAGVPDPVPEFASRADLDEHFARVRAGLPGR
jgi:hypothetical protein